MPLLVTRAAAARELLDGGATRPIHPRLVAAVAMGLEGERWGAGPVVRLRLDIALDGEGQRDGAPPEAASADDELDRVLVAVLFTDIVQATGTAAALGDHRWRELLARHHAVVRRELARFGGRELDVAGDGFLASFRSPCRAVHCASAIRDAVEPLGIRIRAGVHVGECQAFGDKLAGIALHIGQRVAATAGPGEVLVSSTVKELVAGSTLRFEPGPVATLRGLPGAWPLFSVRPAARCA